MRSGLLPLLASVGTASYLGSGPAVSHGGPLSSSSAATASSRVAASPTMKWEVDIAPWELEYGLQRAPVQLPAGVKEGDPPQPWEVTDEQRQRLYEDGAIVIPGVLNEEWLEYLRAATDWQVQNPHFWSIAGVASGLYDTSSALCGRRTARSPTSCTTARSRRRSGQRQRQGLRLPPTCSW